MLENNVIRTRNLEQYAQIHATREYGKNGAKLLLYIGPWINALRAKSVLDYGAGRSELVYKVRSSALQVRDRYDPAIPESSKLPLQRYDVVVCTDVLEHLDQNEIDAVLGHIRQLSDNAVFVVSTGVAKTVLPSGENAHATVQNADWWRDKLAATFPDVERIPISNTRAAFKTWKSERGERARYLMARSALEVIEWGRNAARSLRTRKTAKFKSPVKKPS